MRSLLRAAWFAVHCGVSLFALCWFAVRRRRAVLLFTHWPDVDRDGLDRQMGPLVDALRARGERFIEWTLVALDASLLRNLCNKRRLFVSHAAVLGTARLLAAVLRRDRGQVRIALMRGILRVLRPRTVVLIDESGSGQTLLKAARSLAIRVVGIQHGDFQSDNRQYCAAGVAERGIEPVDVLCVWSDWFQERLLRISPIFHAGNVRVTGRMRHSVPPSIAKSSGRIRVLLLSEAREHFVTAVQPFLDALCAHADFDVRIRPHPAESGDRWNGARITHSSLTQALLESDIVLGVGSSALLEALFWRRPVFVLHSRELAILSDYAEAVPLPICEEPSLLPELCRRVAAQGLSARQASERVGGNSVSRGVWEPIPENPVFAILDELAN